MFDTAAYAITFTDAAGAPEVDRSVLRSAVETALRRHACASASINLVLTDDAQIAALNRRFLGHEGPTDVIAFDLRDEPALAIDAELVISLETAAREAARRGHSVTSETALYAVHGTLHLLGYDDTTEDPADRMHEQEEAILQTLGLCLAGPPPGAEP